MSKRGIDILLTVEDEATPGTYNILGGQRNATLSEERDMTDVTTKDSDGANEYEYGQYGWDISADGLHVASNEAYKYVKKAIREGIKLVVQILEDGVAVEQGTVLVSSREMDAPYDGESTYKVEMQGTGKITELTA